MFENRVTVPMFISPNKRNTFKCNKCGLVYITGNPIRIVDTCCVLIVSCGVCCLSTEYVFKRKQHIENIAFTFSLTS